MKKILKRLVATILVSACILSTFSGCSLTPSKTAILINNVEISNDVFTYFLDCAKVELGASTPYKSLTEKASALTQTYFKTNTLAHKAKISLSIAEKTAVSDRVNSYWNLYGEYYSSIGVTRETLTKVFTADAYRDALLIHYYDEGGEEEIPSSRLYAEFRTNYIVFQAITGYFTQTDSNGQTSSITQNDIEALILKFQNVAAMINQGEQNMEQAADFLGETGYPCAVQTVILNKTDTSFPAGFFDKVQTTEPRKATVIGTNEYIFLVLRGDADANSDYYKDKKPEMIKNIVGDEIDKKIESSLKTEAAVSDSVAKGYYNLIINENGG